ncbi:putative chaperone CsaA [Methylobacterium crusticola]|uniref:Chaperone CsaA n=1 Tax=Methylobacterium crusticola TaxID=1697972 RepID=A0ABQ4R789_9HYPH|nr:tRNA-binding protein [Methylobacterium crusticola]GJD52641.1 putative chaperone CsaA [Methylobacterium crusticola]
MDQTRPPDAVAIGDFLKLDVRAGTVVEAAPIPQARRPALRLVVDFGEPIGRRTSSAQVTAHYAPETLIGRQVLCVVNLPPRQIGPVRSEVLTLGVPDAGGAVVLVVPERPVPDGGRLY